MECKADEANASTQPTNGIRSHRKETLPIWFLDIRQTHSHTQPNDGAKCGIDPQL
jgi:hypothetical protein